MQIDTAGTYLLKYTAEDECGNVTEVTREVVAEVPPTYRTVLYTDGTFIINESSRDQATNEVLHGVATNVYDPFDPNGDTDIKKYIFTSDSQQPWTSARNGIHSVEIGSNISPISTAYWFSNYTNAETIDMSKLDTSAVTDMSYMFRGFGQRVPTSVIDVSPLDTSNVTNMRYMFYGIGATSLDVSPLDTSKVTDMLLMFSGCQSLTSLDLSAFNTTSVTNMGSMFSSCTALISVDLSSFDTSSVTNMGSMFSGCTALISVDLSNFDTTSVTNMGSMFSRCTALTSLDLSNFDTSSVTTMSAMFMQCYVLATIYASASFVVDQVTSSANMFGSMKPSGGTAALVGGAGTAWSSSHIDKTYARIDNPPSAPGYFTLKSA